MDNLARKTIVGFASLIIGVGILLFVPAWTVDYWQAWVYLAVHAGSTALITGYLWKKDPKLLERRVNAGPGAEKEKRQKLIQLLALILFIGIFVVSSLDHRFSWSDVPTSIVILGDFLVALGFFVVFLVFRENTFTAGTIEVAPDQEVISTGPYAIVRHPMYVGGLVLLFGTPLAVGSWCGLLLFIPIVVIIVWRLLEEEAFLRENLAGYAEYCREVRYRLIPFAW